MPSILPALVSLLFLGYGAYVLVSRGANRVSCSFFAVCLITFCWQFTWSILFGVHDPVHANVLARTGYALILFLPTAIYYFVAEITRAPDELRRVGASLLLAAGLAALLPWTNLVVSGTWWLPFGYYPRAGVLHPLHVVQTCVVMLRALFLLHRRMDSALAAERVRLRYCFASLLIYFLAAVDYLCNYGLQLYPPGVLFIALSLGIIAQAIARHHLLANPMLLAATLAHELRTPLATIRSQARALAKGLPELISGYEQAVAAGGGRTLGPQQLAYLRDLGQSIEAEVRRSNFIAETVLVNAREGEFDTRSFGVHSLAACVDEAMACYPFEPGLRHRVRLGRQEDCAFFGSSPLLVFVLYNLLKNALAAVREGGEVELAYWREVDGGRLLVRDTGCGIAPHVLPHVFDPFFTTSSSGTGMGLPFCRKVLTAFGGSIECISREGEFTEVRLAFPSAGQSLPAAPVRPAHKTNAPAVASLPLQAPVRARQE
ncbi:HAMP domain-containing histidine kinase [Massilia arenosa]|uniref:histidine kinase n=1 Tax=Zemynaea arenosa TaxID=2561931 RepID=A0A4Y9SB70_9BURK|nr:sensor histidine kinase [Massilia arenosa]TFW19063.1 HAMP domain-containing histidine kinase [Massilia arenosa]